MNDLVTVLSSAGVSALLTSALVFLTKNWLSERIRSSIQSEYDQKLESHKASLKSQNDTALEEFKAKLQLASSERNIRLTRVFEDTVETIACTYAKLLALHDAVLDYTSVVEWESMGTKESRRVKVGERYTELMQFYRPKRPFLPKDAVEKMDSLHAQLPKTTVEFMIGVEKGGDERAIRRGQDKDSWSKAHNFMTKEVPNLLTVLEDDLRRILGTLNL